MFPLPPVVIPIQLVCLLMKVWRLGTTSAVTTAPDPAPPPAPTLTTTANKLDIISFYWDNDNHKAYGVASLNF